MFLTHCSRLLSWFLDTLPSSEPRAWAALEWQRGAQAPCHFLFSRLCLQTLAPIPHNYFFTFFNIVTHGWACGRETKWCLWATNTINNSRGHFIWLGKETACLLRNCSKERGRIWELMTSVFRSPLVLSVCLKIRDLISINFYACPPIFYHVLA